MCVNGKEGQLYVPLVLIPGLPEKKIRQVLKKVVTHTSIGLLLEKCFITIGQ